MNNMLEKMIENKKIEISVLPEINLKDCESSDRDFLKTIQSAEFSVIGEIKSKSPSEGVICENFDFKKAIEIAKSYESSGIRALSVLTDHDFFGGSYEILKAVREAVSIPVLCKEFILSSKQILKARSSGADACLLIARILSEFDLKNFIDLCELLNMTALVEVFTQDECEKAQRAGAKLIGINNRDLNTLEIDKNRAEKLKPYIKKSIPVISLSGVKFPEELKALRTKFQGVLIGTALMRSKDLGEFKKIILKEIKI